MDDRLKGVVLPCRPPGVELDGRLRGSGFADRQWLIRRDQQFVQVSELLYRVVELADGVRTREEIARELTAATQWEVTSADVGLIIESRLAPLGLIMDADAGDRPPRPRTASPVFADARLRVVGPQAVDRVARVLQHVYRPLVLMAALAAIGISQVWLFLEGDPSSAVQQVVATPLSLPLIAGLLIAAGVFHEFGHAAALRYGGGRARAMGAGFYLFIPVFYTDVTESYRLARHARVRTDLGGVYFHLVAAAAFIAAGAATGNELFFVAAFVIDLDVARQLIPFIRLDGYWLLADLTGIPDLFAHAGPRVKRLIGKGRDGPAPASLRPRIKRIFAAYIVLALPAIAGLLGYVAWHAPAMFRRTEAAVSTRVELVDVTVAIGDWGNALLAIIEIGLLALPSLGLAFFFMVLVRAVVRLVWRRRAAAAPPARSTRAIKPAPERTDSLEAAIAEHLELQRRHAEEDRAASERRQLAAI